MFNLIYNWFVHKQKKKNLFFGNGKYYKLNKNIKLEEQIKKNFNIKNL